MNRQQANAELARRLGLDISENGQHKWRLLEDGSIDNMAMHQNLHNGPICERCYYSYCMHCDDPRDNCTPTPPDYFQDEAAARELVQWFSDQPNVRLRETPPPQRFIDHLRQILFEDAGLERADHHEFLYLHLLATAQQKARAACKAIELELEEEGK